MSVTDRAFIKAYHRDDAGPAASGPHMPMNSVASVPHARPHRVPAAAAIDYVPAVTIPHPAPVEPQQVTAPVAPPEQLDENRVSDAAEAALRELFANELSDEIDGDEQHESTFRESELEASEQVERFHWDDESSRLINLAGDELHDAAARLKSLAEENQKAIAVASLRPGIGATTTTVALARTLAEQGVDVALVDGNLHRPALVNRMGHEFSVGWEDVLQGKVPLTEALVYSRRDGITLLPLRASVPDAHHLADGIAASVSMGLLRKSFEMVLIDVGHVLDEASPATTLLERTGPSGVLLVCDARRKQRDLTLQATERLERTGTRVLGIIENFAVSQADDEGEIDPATTQE